MVPSLSRVMAETIWLRSAKKIFAPRLENLDHTRATSQNPRRVGKTMDQRGLHLLAEQQLSAGDDAFLETIRAMHEPKALASLADKWKNDPRPWARELMRRYVLLPFSESGHEVVVKRLFKQAEQRGDDALMSAFVVAFDRLVRRRRVKHFQYDRASRSVVESEVLRTPRHKLPDRKPMSQAQRMTPRLFSYRTRYYLQRRVWRHFRKLGFRDGVRYVGAIQEALIPYTDADLSAGEHLIDSWSLMHALHGEGEAVEFTSLRATIKEGRTLRELTTTPAFSAHWRSEAGAKAALHVLGAAGSRLVRTWALAWHRELARAHGAQAGLEMLLKLLQHEDEDVQDYGAELVANSEDAASWSIETWLRLLQVEHPRVAQRMTEAMLKHVRADRLSLADCIELASAKAAPIARLGLQFLQQRTAPSVGDREALTILARARCVSMGHEIAQWVLGHLGSAEAYDMPVVCRFFDSANTGIRVGTWQWLNSAKSPAWDDASLWSRLTETPYDDSRLRLVEALTRRADNLPASVDDLARVWTTVLLNVNRGGRQKLRAVQQVAGAIAKQPEAHPTLLPVLATAVRSIRGPEARAALSAVLGLLAVQPELEKVVIAALPELDLHPAMTSTAPSARKEAA
jgi:hypothetical protein